jgi:hypothetical protein
MPHEIFNRNFNNHNGPLQVDTEGLFYSGTPQWYIHKYKKDDDPTGGFTESYRTELSAHQFVNDFKRRKGTAISIFSTRKVK